MIAARTQAPRAAVQWRSALVDVVELRRTRHPVGKPRHVHRTVVRQGTDARERLLLAVRAALERVKIVVGVRSVGSANLDLCSHHEHVLHDRLVVKSVTNVMTRR